MIGEQPKWVKPLKIASILISIFPAALFISIDVISIDVEFGLLIPITFFVMFVIIAMWGIGFFINYLIKRGQYGFAMAVPIVGFFGYLIWGIVQYIISITGPYPATYNLDVFFITSLIILPIPLVYFGIAFVIVTRNKKNQRLNK